MKQRRNTKVRQAELTDAALHIIATEGIVALTTRRLAEQVGLTGGAIFRHFASLDALFDAVVTRVEAVLNASFPTGVASPLERLKRFIEVRSTAVGEQLGILRLVVSEQFLLALPGNGSQRLIACVKKTRAFITACLDEAQAAGEVRNDLDAASLAGVVVGTVQMLAFSKSSSELAVQQVRETLITLLRPSTN